MIGPSNHSISVVPAPVLRNRGCQTMNRLSLLIVVSLACAGTATTGGFPALVAESDTVLYYVSPNGNDRWSGKTAVANMARTDGPFASFQRARDAVRKSIATGLRVSVLIRNGIYRFDSTFALGARDSGRKKRNAPKMK